MDSGVPVVQTVTGPVLAEDLGFTLPHEHTLISLWEIPGRYDYAGITPIEDILYAELMEYKAVGGTCVVDLTLPGMGRDPVGVKALADRTGLNIVIGTGFYREPYYPPEANIDRRTADDLAAEMIREIRHGIGDTGIKPGIIGEIGQHWWWISAQEERVHRAAARAAIDTGLTMTTHTNRSGGLEQLAIFAHEGANLERVIVGHCNWYPVLDYLLEVLDRGASVQFDMFGHLDPTTMGLEERVLDTIDELITRGYTSQVLLSHDVAFDANLKRFGGKGYTYVQKEVIPRLRRRGVSEDAIRTMTVENPRRLLGSTRS